MNSRFILSTAILFFSIFSSGELSCPTEPLTAEDFQPELLKKWLHDNQSVIHSPKEFLCCVPEHVRKSIAIAHSSLAAQNGNVNNPRVLFFSKADQNSTNPDDNKLHFAFSLNSGRKHLTNHDHVELVYADTKTGRLSYFDVEISQKFKGFVEGENPEKCMSCHGTSGKHGPKPLLTDRPWHNFVSGHNFDVFMQNKKRMCDPLPKKLIKTIDLRALDALIDDAQFESSNFACLDVQNLKIERSLIIENSKRPFSPNLFATLSEFDGSLRQAHKHRIWNEMKSHPHFEKSQYLMLGAYFCPSLKLSKWMPRSKAEEFYLNVDFHHPFFRTDRNKRPRVPSTGQALFYTQSQLPKLSSDFKTQQNKYLELLEDVTVLEDFFDNSNSQLHFGKFPLLCMRDNYGKILSQIGKMAQFSPFLSPIEFDNFLARESTNEGNHPVFRLIAEGIMGIPSIDLNMTMFSGVSSNSLNFESLPLLSDFKADPNISAIFREKPVDFSTFNNEFATAVARYNRENIPYRVESPTWRTNQDSSVDRRLFYSTLSKKSLCKKLSEISMEKFKEE